MAYLEEKQITIVLHNSGPGERMSYTIGVRGGKNKYNFIFKKVPPQIYLQMYDVAKSCSLSRR